MIHRDLQVYKDSIKFIVEIYKLTKGFPKCEMYGLTSQMRRAAVSIPSNISEGAGRKGPKEFIHFLYISTGSASELETQLDVAHQLGYITSEEIHTNLIKTVTHIKLMLLNLIKSLEAPKS